MISGSRKNGDRVLPTPGKGVGGIVGVQVAEDMPVGGDGVAVGSLHVLVTDKIIPRPRAEFRENLLPQGGYRR